TIKMQALSLTLRSVTSSKARQVERQRARFEEGKSALEHLLEFEPDRLKRLEAMLEVYKDLPLMPQMNNSTDTFVINLARFLAQAHRDPTLTMRVPEWEARMKRILDIQALRYEYAILWIEVMQEWMNNPDEPEVADGDSTLEIQDATPSKDEYRKNWESLVFNPVEKDKSAIVKWLEELFIGSASATHATNKMKKALDTLKSEVADFEKTMKDKKDHFTQKTIVWCIEGLLRSDLMTDAKRSELKAMQQDHAALRDVIDELNMRINTLDRWAWPSSGVVAEQRRQVGSRHRIFHDEDIMDALLLRYIGVKLSVHICKSLTTFSKSTWLSSESPLGKEEFDRREHFIGYKKEHVTGVRGQCLSTYLSDFFVTQLLRDEAEVDRAYNETAEQDSDSDRTKSRGNNWRNNRGNNRSKDWGKGKAKAEETLKIRKSASELKHSLIQLLITEVHISERLYHQVIVLQSDFQSFGPSIPHSTIAAVLEFFGFSEHWIGFFLRVLEVPVIFKDDGPHAEVRRRQRGTSMSSPLADVWGELILFCMDILVHQRTSGSLLYRFHDDICCGDR
ncbi:MAG: hypothetical protein L6R42_008175, partial [Xanthoria sp. 1 TBL-2021]